MSVRGQNQTSNWGVLVPIAVAALGAIALVWWLLNIPPSVDRSVLGMQGFAKVAKINGDLDIRFFAGNDELKADEIGLRILPLYDPNVSNQFKIRQIKKDEYTLRPLSRRVFNHKIRKTPTLVILPKWLPRAIELQKLHPDLLIPLESMHPPYERSGFSGNGEVKRGLARNFILPPEKVSGNSLGGFKNVGELSLYIPQTIGRHLNLGHLCEPELTFGTHKTLLARCHVHQDGRLPYWLLTDPDIINNHGAGNGDNYQFAVDLVSFLAKGKPIIVDGTNKIFTGEEPGVKKRRRSFADLGRFFEYPFSLVWIAFICLTFFTLWHAWRRVGPIMDRESDDEMRASKATVIEANVSILRGVDKSGTKDSDLARAYATQRMASLSVDLFGAGRKSGPAGEEQFFAALDRRNSTLASNLKTVRTRLGIDSPDGSKKTLFENLKQFEQLTHEARHEFGRPSNAR